MTERLPKGGGITFFSQIPSPFHRWACYCPKNGMLEKTVETDLTDESDLNTNRPLHPHPMSLFMMTEIDREDKTTILSWESICISREEMKALMTIA